MTFTDQFHMPEGIYLLSHSAGCQPKLTQDYLHDRALMPWQKNGECWDHWLSTIMDYKKATGTLLNANLHDICPVSNVSEGFYKFLTALPAHPDRQTVLMHEHAFPSMGFVVQALDAQGYQLKLISAHEDASDPSVWERHIDQNTLAALITHVHSNTGLRSDVTEITSICRARDVYSVIDVAQSAGIVPIDVNTWQASAVVGSCLKWLCGGPGAGFLWVKSDLIQTLTPQVVGWFSHENPFEFDIKHFRYADNANRFWGGTPSIIPFVTALTGLETILTIGIDFIAQHNNILKSTFAEHAGLAVKKYSNPDTGGTICLSLQPNQIEVMNKKFIQSGIRLDCRGHTFRLSFHIYNTSEEAAHVGNIVRSTIA